MTDKTNLNFGQALDAAKSGNKVARETWGGSRWITYSGEYKLMVNYPDISPQSLEQIEKDDVLAEDWHIVE